MAKSRLSKHKSLIRVLVGAAVVLHVLSGLATLAYVYWTFVKPVEHPRMVCFVMGEVLICEQGEYSPLLGPEPAQPEGRTFIIPPQDGKRDI